MTTELSSALVDTSTTLLPGRVITKIGQENDFVHDIAVMPDGRIVLAGVSYTLRGSEVAVARYTTNGTPDLGFSDDGRLTTNFGGIASYGSSVDLLAGGRILVTGTEESNSTNSGNERSYLVMSRYAADGSLDNDFSGDGKVTLDDGRDRDVTAQDAAVQPDGSILIVGDLNQDDTFIAKFRADGTPDTRFASSGERVIEFSDGSSSATATVLQPDGKILVIGVTLPERSHAHFAIARLKTDGTSDSTFSGDGLATMAYLSNTSSSANCAALQADGKIVIAGTIGTNSNADFGVARLNADGTLDKTFSGDGWQKTDFSGTLDRAYCIAIQPDGKILVGGYTDPNPGSQDFALVRYNPNGTLDNSFSGDGKLTIDFDNNIDGARSIAILDNGKIIIAGFAHLYEVGYDRFAMARVNADGSLDRTFGGGELANTAPHFTTGQGYPTISYSRPESATTVITTLEAKDADADTLRYSIVGGADKASFRIGEMTGVLSFARVPDFEAPADIDKNNRYEVIVSVSDGRSGSDSLTVNVSVSDLFGDISGGSGNDNLVGSNNAETIQGLEGRDRLEGRGGSDHLLGSSGVDTAVYVAASSQYRVTERGTKISALSSAEGTDTLTEIERVAFSDVTLAFDIDGNAGTVARYIGAIFGKSAVGNKEYVGIGLKLLDGGTTDDQLMQLALEAKLGLAFTPAAEVDLLYRNLAGKPADSAELAYWTAELERGTFNGVSLAQMAAQLDLNTLNINLAGLAETGLPYVSS
jgi:uncharacterized delta-60 repeat protein